MNCRLGRRLRLETLVAAGWRVAILPVIAFTDRGFSVGEPGEVGHQNVYGAYEDFARYSRELRTEARLLSAQECLAG